MSRPTSQPVPSPMTSSAIFLVLTIDRGGEAGVRDFLGGFTGLVRSVATREPDQGLNCIVGVGSRAFDRLFSGPRPAQLHPFIPLTGPVHSAPSTPGDVLFHIRASRMDLCFELATHIGRELDGIATVVDEVHGFRFFDMRDIIGFVDGTENPEGDEAANTVQITAEQDPNFVGGCYVTVQKYLHDMAAWDAAGVTEQEKTIGRSKLDNIEMADDAKPANAHSALTVVEDEDGVQQKILRENMPFGSVSAGEYGTYFIGYAADVSVTEEMLRNMFIGKPEGNYDRILDFSTAVTGSQYFVPTADFLDDPPPLPTSAATSTADGSLGIGSNR